MIELHTWGTPNGRKISIMLEECGLPYSVHKVDISKGEQFKPEFLRISPNNRIPAIVDPEGPGGKPYSLFESGAILIYLADKTKKFMPADAAKRYDALQWLMWQMGGFGPMLGQAHHFLRAAPTKKQLAGNAFVAGEDYTIADMSIFPWAARHEWHTVNLADFPNVKRWYDIVNARPAVTKGMSVPYLN